MNNTPSIRSAPCWQVCKGFVKRMTRAIKINKMHGNPGWGELFRVFCLFVYNFILISVVDSTVDLLTVFNPMLNVAGQVCKYFFRTVRTVCNTCVNVFNTRFDLEHISTNLIVFYDNWSQHVQKMNISGFGWP